MTKYRLIYNSKSNKWDIEKRNKFLWVFSWWEFYLRYNFENLTEAIKIVRLANKSKPSGIVVHIPI